mgnify:CR=1 FL=1
MRVLLTNDDGIYAQGLYALYEIFKKDHEVFIVAPENEQSAVGHAITLSYPLRVKEIYRNGIFYGYAVSGTPADAVKIAVNELISPPPDIVISGINAGPNVGINVLYSGTVSAATEAAILGISAMAISLDAYTRPDFKIAATFAYILAEKLPKLELPPGVCLNVNIPALPLEKIKGIAFTRQATVPLRDRFEKRIDPRHHVYYWEAGDGFLYQPEPDTDIYALTQGMISITPIHHDLTNYHTLEQLRNTPFIKINDTMLDRNKDII